MKLNKLITFLAAAPAVVIIFGIGNTTMGQAYSVVKPIERTSYRISSLIVTQEQDRTGDSSVDEQQSNSDFLMIDDNAKSSDEIGRNLQDEERNQPQRAEFGPWPRKGIRGISIDAREKSGTVPEDRSAQLLNSGGSEWSSFASSPKVFAWAAPNIRYQPLYFEDVALERYGQTAPAYRQSALSAIHLFKSFVLLPHQMRHDAPGSCDSPLGFCRPGNTVPYTIQRSYFGRPQR